MADTINLDASQKIVSVQGLDHYHDKVMAVVDGKIDTMASKKIDVSQKGTSGGVAELDENGKVLSSQLPSYVDGVLEYNNISEFPKSGKSGKIYVSIDTNLTYRWTGTGYTEISPSIALGETASTAYRGDRGKVAYDHSQNADIHVTAGEKSTWDSKADKADIPAKLGYVNYLGYVSDVDNTLNNPNYSECSYECVITTVEAVQMGLPSCWWQIKYLRHTDNNGFGCQVAFPIDGPDNPPRYRTSAGLVWADWKLLCDGGNANTLDGKHVDDLIYARGILENIDLDTIKYPCSALANVSCTNKPVDEWGTFLAFVGGSGSVSQLYIPTVVDGTQSTLWMRHFGGTGWSAWRNVSNGGNAATLDSHPASDFALQNTFAAHVIDNTVHVTAAEKASWGGCSNENLFDNPDFAINQRGATQYSVKEKTGVDRWTLQGSNSTIKMTVLPSGGVQIENGGENAGIKQFYPADEITAGETYTISADIDGVRHSVAIVAATDNSGVAAYPGTTIYAAIIYDSAGKKWAIFPYVTYTAGQSAILKDVKLELGSRATRFVKPVPAAELLKCQRYYQIRSTNSIDPIDLRPTMRTAPKDITKVEGGYAYVAEY